MILLFLSDRERLLENGFLNSALSNLFKGCRRKILFLLEFVPFFSIFFQMFVQDFEKSEGND